MFFEKRFARAWIGAGLIIILIGVIFEMLISTSAANQSEASEWPTVTGTVRSAEFRPSGSSAGTPESSQRLSISYLYTVKNESFAGNQEIRIGLNSTDLTTKYGSGQPILVYYNPNAPVQSLIDPNTVEPVEDQNLLAGPKNVLLASAIVASLPFIGIGIGLLLTGKNLSTPRRYKKTYRGKK